VVLPGADAWPAGLSEALGKLGVHVLDTSGFELPLELLRGLCVHSTTGTGVAAALAAVMKQQGLLQGQQQQQQQGQVQQRQPQQPVDVASKLDASQRRLLRSFLLQRTWFAGTVNAAMGRLHAVARELAMYELANSSWQQEQDSSEGEGQAAAEVEPVFVNLEGNCSLAPAGGWWLLLFWEIDPSRTRGAMP
jgi:hypothetical protein